MDFAFSAEQEMLRAAARSYLADRYPIDRVVELADSEPGWDPASWKEFADLGWLDADLGALEHAVLFEETGAALYPGPLFSTIGLAGSLLPDDLASAVSTGERTVTLAVAEPGGPMGLADAARVAVNADVQGRLTGRKVLVPDAALVSDALVVAAGPSGPAVYAVELDPSLLTPRATIDRTRRLADLTFAGTPARPIRTDDVPARLAAARRCALSALATEAVGVAQHALDLAVEHAKTRQQFGRVIGTYQAVSHQVADTYLAVELARSLAYWAAWAVSEDAADAELAVSAAMAAASRAAVTACERAIQVHGGIGFTWEHPLHRYYKRAQWIAAYDGSPAAHRAAIAAAILG